MDEKRTKRATRASERALIDALPLAEHYADLKLMGVEDLRDQLQKHKLLGKIWLCALPAKPPGVRAASADAAPRGQRGRERPRRRRIRHRRPQRSAPHDCPRPEAQARAALLHWLRVNREGGGGS
eukprot:6212570-Pleurochrysis_carterae.AAC.2